MEISIRNNAIGAQQYLTPERHGRGPYRNGGSRQFAAGPDADDGLRAEGTQTRGRGQRAGRGASPGRNDADAVSYFHTAAGPAQQTYGTVGAHAAPETHAQQCGLAAQTQRAQHNAPEAHMLQRKPGNDIARRQPVTQGFLQEAHACPSFRASRIRHTPHRSPEDVG